MTDEELRDELMTLLVAGHETTATALAWAFELLLKNPETLARLEREIADGGDEYLDAVIKETLRIRPVLPIVGRNLAAGRHARWVRPAGRHDGRAVHLPHPPPPRPLSRAGSLQARALPRVPSPTPTRGCRSAAASAAASGASFAMFEMKVVIPVVLRALRAAAARPSPSRCAAARSRSCRSTTRWSSPSGARSASARLIRC